MSESLKCLEVTVVSKYNHHCVVCVDLWECVCCFMFDNQALLNAHALVGFIEVTSFVTIQQNRGFFPSVETMLHEDFPFLDYFMLDKK